MTQQATAYRTSKSNSFMKAVLLTGFIAGTLDILSAIVNFYMAGGKEPIKIFYYIASAVLGKQAYPGTPGVALLGLLLHYIIAYLFTWFFYIIYPKISRVSGNKIVNAVVYGFFVWAVMNLVVVPISALPTKPHFVMKNAIIALLILIVMIGLPNSLMASKYYSAKKDV